MIDTLDRLNTAKVIAVIRTASVDDALAVCDALVEGGIQAIELTYSVPDVRRAIRLVRERLGTAAIVGAGTLTEVRHAREAAAAGAEFLVAPHLDPHLLAAMLETGLTSLPGVLTPSEAVAAVAHGARAVKLFPAASVGPAHLRALLAPFPSLKVVPTGGVGIANAPDWLAAGAWALGVGGELAPRTLAGDAERNELVERARALLGSLA
jgi:2-dehydro-3-deoxyphosphogluconate aldolase/(4S)-4-hydroxy-2-oxoglutarate aldolase